MTVSYTHLDVYKRQVNNQGWDISANWRQGGTVAYNFGVIVSPVSNSVEKLAEGRSEIFAAFLQGEPASHTIVGLPIGSFYGYKVGGIFQTQEEIDGSPTLGGEKPGDIRYEDTNLDGILNGDDRVYLGSPIPKITYSFTAGVEWNGFDFNADILGAGGHYVFNAKETFRFSVYNWELSLIHISFKLTSKDLAFYTADMTFKAEPGAFWLMVGPDSERLQKKEIRLVQ